MAPTLPLLAFIGPIDYAFDRQIAIGILEYLQATGSGRLLNAEGDTHRLAPEHALNHQPPVQGIIHHNRNAQTLSQFRALGAKIVNVADSRRAGGDPSVVCDDIAIGRLGADHFLSRGYRHFAYAGFPGHGYSCNRWLGFRERVHASGFTPSAIGIETAPSGPAVWDRMAEDTADWVRDLPLPCAILACNDGRARMLAVTARQLGLRIPEDVAILGVDNDEFICVLSPVPLSSIEPDCRAIGREAARMILDLLAGRIAPQPAPRLIIPPVRIVERRSTDALAVSDDHVARALRFIHTHALEPIGVDEIAGAAGLARRKLERAFREHTGASPYAEILRLRIEHAKALLATSRLKVSEISEQCGFATAPEFSVAFRKRTGVSPLKYRRERNPVRPLAATSGAANPNCIPAPDA